MSVNKITLNLKDISTATTINVPITLNYQPVDNSDIIEKKFVETEVENAINPIIDYEKVRFTPIYGINFINQIIYEVNLLDKNKNYVNTYGLVGFDDDDILFGKESFSKTYINLNFYDSDNPLSQNLISYITLFSELNTSDLSNTSGSLGIPKPANQIPINFVIDNPLSNKSGNYEGFYVYDFKSDYKIGIPKYLYMKTTFRNAKTGIISNLMVKNIAKPINELVHELYTRFKLVRNNDGYYYEIDDTYNGNSTGSNTNNVTYNNGVYKVQLYEIKVQ